MVLQIGLVLSITIVLGTVSYFIMFQSVRANQQENLEHIAVNIGEKVNVLIAHKEQILEKTADSEVVANYFKKQQENVLVDYFGRFMPEFAALSYVNSDGIEEVKLVNGKTEASILNKSDSALIEQLKQSPNKTLNSYQPFSSETNGPCIELGFLNMSFFDEFVGIILGKVSVVDMVESVQGFRLGQTGSAILLDSEGTILSCRDKNKILTKIAIEGTDAERIMAEIKAVKSGFGRATISGIDSYFAYAPVKGQNWLTITILPYKEFAAKLNTMKLISLLVGLIVLVIGVVLSSMLAVNITRPISKLIEATTIIAEGNFTQRIDIKSKDEIETLAESFNQMTENLKNTTTSIVNLNREIAERKLAEEKINNSQKLLKRIINILPIRVFWKDKNSRYLGCNEIFAKDAGKNTAEDLIGKDDFQMNWKEQAKCYQNDDQSVITSGISKLNYEELQTTPNGDKIWLKTSKIPLMDFQENIIGILGTYEDITERKLAEENLKKLNYELEQTVTRLEETNQELKNFVYIASHDLREPLRKISAFGEVLQKSLTGKIDSDDSENLNFMIDGAARMSKMIEGLLAYSKVSTKTHSAEAVNLNDTVKEIGQLELSIAIEEKNAIIDIPQPLPEVEVDPVQIRQLMQNLIANGMKYQAKGNVPHITIISRPAANGMVRINITDNGIGIAPEFQQAIFIMFKRLHSRSEYEGTGIGLAVCKKIVERHGGQIGVESESGKGSTFWFTVPVCKKQAALAAETH
jgi:hypothetical protein